MKITVIKKATVNAKPSSLVRDVHRRRPTEQEIARLKGGSA